MMQEDGPKAQPTPATPTLHSLWARPAMWSLGTRFTCFTSKKVQMLTHEELRSCVVCAPREIVHYVADSELQMYQVLNLLAFLVQKYKY